MMNNLRRTVKEAIGENAQQLSEDWSKKLFVEKWRNIFGQPISASFDDDLRKTDMLNTDGIFFDFFDTNIRNQRHEFAYLYRYAVVNEVPSESDSEAHLQSYLAYYFDESARLINDLQQTDEILTVTLNKSLGISTDTFSIPYHANKRIKLEESQDSYFTPGSANYSTMDFKNCKPDIMINDNSYRTLFVCQLKNTLNGNQEDVDRQLVFLAMPFNKVGNNVHLFFAATLVGHYLQLYLLEQRDGFVKKLLISRYNMRNVSCRIKFATNMLTICYIISILSASNQSPLIPITFRRTCSLQFLINENKLLKLKDVNELIYLYKFESDRLDLLENFYKLIKSAKKKVIVNSLTCYEVKKNTEHNTLMVSLGPIGTPVGEVKDWKKFEDDVTEFLKSLHANGYIHNDLRLANIVFHEDNKKSKFLVIDYENIVGKCVEEGCDHSKDSDCTREDRDWDCLKTTMDDQNTSKKGQGTSNSSSSSISTMSSGCSPDAYRKHDLLDLDA